MAKRKLPPRGFLDRLKMAMVRSGIVGPVALGKKVGVNKQTAAKWLNGQTPNLGADDLFRLSGGLEVAPRWLWRGEGPMTGWQGLDADEHALVALYRELAKSPDGWAADYWLAQGNELRSRITLPPSTTSPYPKAPKNVT